MKISKIVIGLMLCGLVACSKGSGNANNPSDPSPKITRNSVAGKTFTIGGKTTTTRNKVTRGSPSSTKLPTIAFDQKNSFKTTNNGALAQTGQWDVKDDKLQFTVNGVTLIADVSIEGSVIVINILSDEINQVAQSNTATSANIGGQSYPCYPDIPYESNSGVGGGSSGSSSDDSNIPETSLPGTSAGSVAENPSNSVINQPAINLSAGSLGANVRKTRDQVATANSSLGMPVIIFINIVSASSTPTLPGYEPCTDEGINSGGGSSASGDSESNVPDSNGGVNLSGDLPSDVPASMVQGTWCYESGDKIDNGAISSVTIDETKEAYVSFMTAQNSYYPVYDFRHMDNMPNANIFTFSYGGFPIMPSANGEEKRWISAEKATFNGDTLIVRYDNALGTTFRRISTEQAVACPVVE